MPPQSGTIRTPKPQPLKSPDAVFVGKDETGEMAVGIAVKGGRAVAYLCDGRSVEAWLSGTATGGRVTLNEPNGPGTVFADIMAPGSPESPLPGATSSISPRRRRSLRPACTASRTATPRSAGSSIRTVSQVGIANTGGEPRPAPALDPTSSDAERVTGQTRLGGGT